MVLERRSLLAIAIAICAALAFGIVLQRSDERSPGPSSGTRATSEQEGVSLVPEVATTPSDGDEVERPFDANHVNASGEYVFSYPAGWTVRETGTFTKLSSEDKQIAISFGLGPSGGIEPAYEDFVSLIDETYDRASVRLVRGDSVEGSLRVKLIGTATTEAGFPIWFTGRVIAPRGEQTLATLAAGPLKSRDTEAERANQILDSFEPIATPGTS